MSKKYFNLFNQKAKIQPLIKHIIFCLKYNLNLKVLTF